MGVRAPGIAGAAPGSGSGPGRAAGGHIGRGLSTLSAGPVLPAALVLAGAVSVQSGAGIAARLFGQLPPASVTTLRLWSAALIMLLVAGRGTARAVAGLAARRAWTDSVITLTFGIALGFMNFAIYQAFARIPLGIAVTVEFLGPLGVAVASSRRLLDLVWVGLAGAGVALLSRAGADGGARAGHGGEFALGVAFAVAAGLAWAAYILLSRATGRRFPGTSGLTIAMVVAAVAITPIGIAAGGAALLGGGIVVAGLGIGLLSSVIPYSLELHALRRIPARVFGIWMSLEPAVAALVGLALLGQSLAIREWIAIGCVMVACAGAARGTGGPTPQV